MIDQIATISTNNDPVLGKLIADAFRAVGETGVVIMEHSDGDETTFDIVEGVEYDKGLLNPNLITNKEKGTVEIKKKVQSSLTTL
jgi:chaperonin GroEL